jgi:adenylate cyclase class 2
MREIEIKLKAGNLEAVATKLEELGCTLSKPKTQEDINFVHKDDVRWYESSGEGWIYPRLRIQNDTVLTFTVKKPLTNEMDCIEHEIQIDDGEALKAMMEMFGYRQGVAVKKTRRSCAFQNYTITLDKVDRLGSFIEIERVVDDGDAEKMQEEMFVFAKEMFGLERDTRLMKGYDILIHDLEQSSHGH